MPDKDSSKTITEDKILLVESSVESAGQENRKNVASLPAASENPTASSPVAVDKAVVTNRPTAEHAADGSSVNSNTKDLNAKDRSDAEKILKELPTDEFLSLLDQSSPEQLERFLSLLGPGAKQPAFQMFRSMFGKLVSVPDEPRGAASIVAWWEARRFVFNMVVFLCGLPTLAIVYLSGLTDLGFAISGSIEYGILANICYSAGWICELVARSWWGERAKHLGPILFTLGFAFSVLITLGAGIVMILLFCLINLVRAM